MAGRAIVGLALVCLTGGCAATKSGVVKRTTADDASAIWRQTEFLSPSGPQAERASSAAAGETLTLMFADFKLDLQGKSVPLTATSHLSAAATVRPASKDGKAIATHADIRGHVSRTPGARAVLTIDVGAGPVVVREYPFGDKTESAELFLSVDAPIPAGRGERRDARISVEHHALRPAHER